MGSALSKFAPQFATLPLELVHYILELSLQPPSGRLGLQHTWVARVARVSKFANRIATPILYDIIQLEEGWALVLLLNTLASRPDLAHSVKALHIGAVKPANRNDLAYSMGALLIDTQAVIQSSSRKLVILCKNAFLQVNNVAFDPNGLLAGPVSEIQAPYRYLSMACAVQESLPLGLQLLHTTHLHFGMGKGAPGWAMFCSVAALAEECGRVPATAITHVAFDWDPESNCCGDLLGVIADFLDHAPLTLERLTVRFPVFTTEFEQMRIGRRQVALRRSLSAIDDSRLCISFVEVRASRAEDRMHEMALEGWRRHAQGVEDLWMSGHPVYSV